MDPRFPPRPSRTLPLTAPRYRLPRPLAQPARAAEGTEPSRPTAGATAPLPPGSGQLQTAAAGPGTRGEHSGGSVSPYLPASSPAAERNVPSPRPPSSPAAIATGSRGRRLSREAPSSRESRGPRRWRREAPPLARGLREHGSFGLVWYLHRHFSFPQCRAALPWVGASQRAVGLTRCPVPEGARGLRCV